jgi:hypothetical protein
VCPHLADDPSTAPSQNERRTHSTAIHRRVHRNRPDGSHPAGSPHRHNRPARPDRRGRELRSRSLVEFAILRSKVVSGWTLRTGTLPTQKTEAKIGCKVVNVMTALGMPISYRIGRTSAKVKSRSKMGLGMMLFGSALAQVFSNCAAQSFRAPLQRAPLVDGHLRQERLDNALPSDHARRRQRDAVVRIVDANREYRALISQHDLGDARADRADAVLARAEAFDDRDIGKAHVLLHLAAESVKAAPPRFASASTTPIPPIRADDQRNTFEVPCSPTT